MKEYVLKNTETESIAIHIANNANNLPAGYELVGELSQELPDRHYRNCWKLEDGFIVVDMGLARAQELRRVEEKQIKYLELSDKHFVVEMSKGADLAQINSDKEDLRAVNNDAQIVLSNMNSLQDMKEYDPFSALELNYDYSEIE